MSINHLPSFDLSSFSKIRLSGKDRAAFLQNFTTNDVIKPGVGYGCESFVTTAQARIVAWLRIAIKPDAMYVNMEPGLAAKVISYLEHFVIGEQVEFQDCTDEDFLWLVQDAEIVKDLSLWQHRNDWMNEPTITIQRSDFLGNPAAFIWGPRSKQTWAQEMLGGGVLSQDDPLWNSLRLEAGTPAYGLDFDETNLPQEVNRTEQTISFTKGCYIGQETVARIRAYGHVNKQLKRVRLDEQAGEQVAWVNAPLLVAGKEVGKLKTVAYSHTQRAMLAFAMIRKEHLAAGTILQAQARDKVREAEVLA